MSDNLLEGADPPRFLPWGLFPITPTPENSDGVELRDIRTARLQRRSLRGGGVENCPEVFDRETLPNWQEVYARYGGGHYRVTGMGGANVFRAHYPCGPNAGTKEWMRFEGPSKPFVEGVAARDDELTMLRAELARERAEFARERARHNEERRAARPEAPAAAAGIGFGEMFQLMQKQSELFEQRAQRQAERAQKQAELAEQRAEREQTLLLALLQAERTAPQTPPQNPFELLKGTLDLLKTMQPAQPAAPRDPIDSATKLIGLAREIQGLNPGGGDSFMKDILAPVLGGGPMIGAPGASSATAPQPQAQAPKRPPRETVRVKLPGVGPVEFVVPEGFDTASFLASLSSTVASFQAPPASSSAAESAPPAPAPAPAHAPTPPMPSAQPAAPDASSIVAQMQADPAFHRELFEALQRAQSKRSEPEPIPREVVEGVVEARQLDPEPKTNGHPLTALGGEMGTDLMSAATPELILKASSGDLHAVDRMERPGFVMRAPALTVPLTVQPDVIPAHVSRRNADDLGLTGDELVSEDCARHVARSQVRGSRRRARQVTAWRPARCDPAPFLRLAARHGGSCRGRRARGGRPLMSTLAATRTRVSGAGAEDQHDRGSRDSHGRAQQHR